MEASANISSVRTSSSLTMPLTKLMSSSPSYISQKWFGYRSRRAAKLSRLAASAGGKHSASTRVISLRSFMVAWRIVMVFIPSLGFPHYTIRL